MTPFLKQVAVHYRAQGQVERTCFIFPNQRAKSFFKKWLCEDVAASGTGPVVAPVMMTMNDFFYRLAGAARTDRIVLLLELFDRYCELNDKAESLDDFIFWGDVLLSDFDDVDKYLVNASGLFANVSDFKSIQDTYSYLTEEQVAAIKRFLAHFRSEGGLTVNLKSEDDKDVKVKFLRIWDILARLYAGFNTGLKAKGYRYEGQVYREVAERAGREPVVDLLSKKVPECSRFVFVGLNALNECEKLLMSRMRDAGVAEFCWDYSGGMIRDEANKSSMFLARNVVDFPQAFRLDPEGLPTPEVNVLSVPSGIGMTKQLPEILRRLPQDIPGIETAIVLPDEGLLLPVLNSIPGGIRDLNVTMGYPMGASELWSLMNDIAALQMHLRCKDGRWMFYHRQVWSIFSNAVFKSVLTEEGRSIVEDIRKGVKYYIQQEELAGDPVMELIFKPVVTDASGKDPAAITAIQDYQQELLSGIGARLKSIPDMSVELDFARSCYLAIDKLRLRELPVLPATYFRLLGQLVSQISVPFHGEPLKGLQIMGPLETRALDFENVVILSCNEGMFPRRSVSSSFIPPELRKGFGLPTYEFQDAVWAYYFYRMIQRAGRVWMMFDSRTEGLKGGEESRYIKQLELHFGLSVRRFVVKAPIECGPELEDIPKTEEHLQLLRDGHLSASALQNYLSCPAKFYYASVERLKEDDEVSESLDAGSIGNVFHKTMELLYKGHDCITAEFLDGLLADTDRIKAVVDGQIKEQLHTFEIAGRNIIFEDVVCSYVRQVLRRDRELLDSYGTDRFRILGLEQPLKDNIGGFRFIGFADRLDSFKEGEIRIVDYKTGRVQDDDFLIDEDNAAGVVDKLFGEDNAKRPKIALQLYLYDRFISSDSRYKDLAIVNSIYQTSRLFVNEVENVALNEVFCGLMSDRLEGLLAEIRDLDRPWKHTDDEKTCEHCDFKMICGR